MSKIIKKTFCMALITLLCIGALHAQLVEQKKLPIVTSHEVTYGKTLEASNSAPKADLLLAYISGSASPIAGFNLPVGTTYVSGCISFTAGQMFNYIGAVLHTIEVAVPNTTTYMPNLTSYKIWIKTALDGPIVYEETVTPEGGGWNEFELATPYTITSGPLVIGFTAGFTLTEAGPRFPLWYEAGNYQPGAFNRMTSSSPTGHGAGAAFGQNTSGTLGIIGHVTGNPLPANDLCVNFVSSSPLLKWKDNADTYSIGVYNSGSVSQNNYTVQLIDQSNNVLASQTITTALAARALNTVSFSYAPVEAGTLTVKGKVILTGDQSAANDVSDPLTQTVYPLKPMAYCDNSPLGGVGAGAVALHAAIGYPAASMAPYAGKNLTAIEFAINDISVVSGNVTVWLRSALTGSNLYSKSITAVQGWNKVTLETPYTLPASDIYIGYTLTATGGFPLGTTANTQDAANGGHIAVGTGAWSTLSAASLSGNNGIIGTVESEDTPPTDDCNAPTNLAVNYTTDCKAELSWDAPAINNKIISHVTKEVQTLPNYNRVSVKNNPNRRSAEVSAFSTTPSTYQIAAALSAPGKSTTTLSPAAFTMPCGLLPDSLMIYSDENSNYVTGSNAYGDTKFGYVFKGASGAVTSVKTWLLNAYAGYAENIYAEIWALGSNDLPSTLIGTSQPISTANITYSIMNEYTFTFAAPVTVPANFAAVITVPEWTTSAPWNTDIIVCSSPLGCYAPGTEHYPISYSWVSEIAQGWLAMNDAFGFEPDGMFDLAIFPVMEGDTPPSGETTYNVYRDNVLVSTVNTTSYTDTDFNAATGHTWSVAAVCENGGESEKISVQKDACGNPCVINSFPWVEGFTETTFPPNCWTRLQVSGNGNWTRGTTTPWDGGYAYRADVSGNNQETWLITPPIDLSEGVFMLDFMSYIGFSSYYYGGNGNGRSRVFISTTTNETSQFEELYFLQGSDVTEAWQKISISLQAYSGETVYLAFVYTGGYDHNWRVDDVTVRDISGDVDVEMASIITPHSGEGLSSNEPVKVLIKNNGGSSISGFDLQLEFNGVIIATETYTGSIPSLSQAEYTFTANVNLSAQASYVVKASIIYEDQVPENNALTKYITNFSSEPVELFGYRIYDNVQTPTPLGFISFMSNDPETIVRNDNFTHTSPANSFWAGEFVNGYFYAYAVTSSTTTTSRAFVKVSTDTWTTVASNSYTSSTRPGDMAYDHSTKTMYGISSTNLVRINMTTGALTTVGAMGRTAITLACNLEGQLYIVDSNGNLCSVNKTTGATTVIGNTGIAPAYVQSMSFDHFTGRLFWAMCNTTDAGMLVELEPTTGAAFERGTLGGDAEVIGLYTPYYSEFIITASAGEDGIITPNGEVVVANGDDQTFTFTPDECYQVDQVLINGVNDPVAVTSGSYTFTNVTSNQTIAVSFKPTDYTITATSDANGSITPSGVITVDCGSDQTFTFTPSDCYQIDQVLINGENNPAAVTSGSYTFTNVTSDQTIAVSFKPIPYTITASADPNGSITPSGVITVDCGTDQTFTFTAADCYRIDQVLINGINDLTAVISGIYTFTNVTSDQTIAVSFKPTDYIITASSDANGSITPSGVITVDCGSDQTFTFTPSDCYQIDQVLINGENNPAAVTSGSYTFTNVTSDQTIAVSFKPIPYTITASADPNGSITPSGVITVDCGTDQTFTFTPSDCYQVDQVLINGENNPAAVTSGSYTFTNVTSDQTIAVSFKLIPYTITALAGPNGKITPSGSVSVDCGTDQTFTFTPDRGYQIAQVLIDGVNNTEAIASGNYTFVNVREAHTIEVNFVPLHMITVSYGSGGKISPNGLIMTYTGENKTFTIMPNNGYKINQVLIDGVNDEDAVASGVYTFEDVTDDHSLVATFTYISGQQYFITASSGTTGGVISPNGKVTVMGGDDYMFTITPNAGYKIKEVLVDGVNNPTAVEAGYYIFENISASHTIVAKYEKQSFTITASVDGIGGTITPAGETVVTYDGSKAYVITSQTGYMISEVLIDGVNDEKAVSSGKYTFKNVMENHTIVVSFKPRTYEITATAGDGGTIAPEGISTITYGNSVTYDIVADAGYKIKAVMVDGKNNSAAVNSGVYTFSNVTAKHTIAVTFTAISNAPMATGDPKMAENNDVILKVYPNPTVGTLNIESGALKMNDVKVFDITGRLVLEVNNIDHNETKIDLSNYADGVYFIRVDGKTTKVIKR